MANPICMPNRCSMLTGRVPSAHGVIFNDRSLTWTANTFVRVMRQAGYATGLVGKLHIQHGMTAELVGRQRTEAALYDPFPRGWNTWEDPERFLPARARTLLTEEGRITRYSTGELEVFDRHRDPDELVNLANRPEGHELRQHLSDRLLDAMITYADMARPVAQSAA